MTKLELKREFAEIGKKHYFNCDQFGSEWPTNIDEICIAANSLIDDIVDEYVQKIEAEDPALWEDLIDERINDLDWELQHLWEKYCEADEINGVKGEWDDDE